MCDHGGLVLQCQGQHQHLGGPARVCRVEAADPHLQDAPSLVVLFLRKHVSGEEGVAVQADSVGPVGIILELRPVVRAPGTHHLGGQAGAA